MFRSLSYVVFILLLYTNTGLDARKINYEELNGTKINEIYYIEDGVIKREQLPSIQDALDAGITFDSSKVSLFLYTQNNRENSVKLSSVDISDLKNCELFGQFRENVFIIHGWKNNHDSEVNVLIRNAILAKYNVNVFVVEWTPALGLYISAKSAFPYVGKLVGEYIHLMIKNYQLSSNQFKCIGHSLGAHTCGVIGEYVGGQLDYIVGLDPAYPLIDLRSNDGRLDETDAEFVEVIHTNGQLLGIDTAIGHADYYPNGGQMQPGCEWDLFGACSHSRAYIYYAEAIGSSDFISYLCNSIQDFHNGYCFKNKISVLGKFKPDKSTRGDYYLHTTSRPPFAVGSLG